VRRAAVATKRAESWPLSDAEHVASFAQTTISVIEYIER
jgi:hypothetical protein